MFSRVFPDSKKWMKRLGRDNYNYTGLCKGLKYHGPPECLTMWLCLIGRPQLNDWSAAWVKQNSKTLKLKFVEYVRTHKFAPVPLILAKLVDA